MALNPGLAGITGGSDLGRVQLEIFGADPAGLQNNNARDYSPATGRFISPDPTGMAGSGDNLYGYAGGDPADNSDPSGLQWQLLGAGCAIGGLANDLGGALDGRKHSLGDFFTGGLAGCLQGALLFIPGAGEALDTLEGADGVGDAVTSVGTDGAEDVSSLGDNVSGDGTGQDGLGEDSCTTAPNSFPPNTRVEMADGKTKLISQVKPGDKVLAANSKTGKIQPEPVLALITGHKTEHYAAITITTGIGRARRTGIIVATKGHPFYDIARHAWVAAGSMHTGDRLETLNHTRAVVLSIRRFDQRQAIAHNLTIGHDYDYYIYAGGIKSSVLVHNCEWATQSGILREAAAGKGNFGLGAATEQVANEAGQAWVGPGYRVASDGRTLISEDGLRAYRPPTWKARLGKWQANFEWRNATSGQWFGNGHLDITDMP